MNKPIAWTTDELNTDNWGDTDWQITVTKEKWSDRQKPLYTHPAKTLTAQEVMEQTHRNISEAHWKEQAKIYRDDLIKAQKLFSNMHKSATEAWDSLDLKDQSDLDCAREWFFEGFAHGNTAQAEIEALKEDNEAYEKGFIDGMAKQRDSKVQQIVEGYAKLRELADEEILDFINAFCTDMGDYWDLNETNAVPMIRAILRKAQEKNENRN